MTQILKTSLTVLCFSLLLFFASGYFYQQGYKDGHMFCPAAEEKEKLAVVTISTDGAFMYCVYVKSMYGKAPTKKLVVYPKPERKLYEALVSR